MSTKVEKTAVRLQASNDVEIQPGVILPAGLYEGTRKRLGVHFMGGLSWCAPEYLIELRASQLAEMGASVSGRTISIEFDVTKFVKANQIVEC